MLNRICKKNKHQKLVQVLYLAAIILGLAGFGGTTQEQDEVTDSSQVVASPADSASLTASFRCRDCVKKQVIKNQAAPIDKMPQAVQDSFAKYSKIVGKQLKAAPQTINLGNIVTSMSKQSEQQVPQASQVPTLVPFGWNTIPVLGGTDAFKTLDLDANPIQTPPLPALPFWNEVPGRTALPSLPLTNSMPGWLPVGPSAPSSGFGPTAFIAT
jgi:hypothetical protein